MSIQAPTLFYTTTTTTVFRAIRESTAPMKGRQVARLVRKERRPLLEHQCVALALLGMFALLGANKNLATRDIIATASLTAQFAIKATSALAELTALSAPRVPFRTGRGKLTALVAQREGISPTRLQKPA